MVNPEVFTKIGARLSTTNITILPKGSFFFSAGLVHLENLAKFSHCILGYDATEEAICFQFSNDEKAPGAIRMNHRKAGNSSIQSGAFFRYYKLDPIKLSGKYPVQKESIPERGEWFVVYLKPTSSGTEKTKETQQVIE